MASELVVSRRFTNYTHPSMQNVEGIQYQNKNKFVFFYLFDV